MSSWDSLVEGGAVGQIILKSETTASVQDIVGIPAAGSVGSILLTVDTTASGQGQLGGNAVGINIFESTTTASAQDQLGAGTVGKNLFEASTTASAVSQLNIQTALRINTKASAYEVTANDDVILLDASAAFTVVLPTASGRSGKKYYFKRVDSQNLTVTVSAPSQTIDGAVNVGLVGSSRPFKEIISDGSNWAIIGESSEI